MSSSTNWSIADAKAQLSEILRLAKQGKPQVIGLQSPCVVISLEAYEASLTTPRHDGRWLIERASKLDFDIEFPPRSEDRADPDLGD